MDRHQLYDQFWGFSSEVMETLAGTELCFPQLMNTSCRKPIEPHFEIMLMNILSLSISVLTVALNLLVIISISHFKQLHTPTNLILLSLSMSDFSVGLIFFFQIVLVDGCWLLGHLMCTLFLYLTYIITSASTGTMVLISVDRYVAICEPLHYTNKVTKKRVNVCVCLCWTCSVVFQSLTLMNLIENPGRHNSCSGVCIFVSNYIASLADLIVSFIIPINVIVVLYMRVFVVAVSQARAMRSHIAVTNQRSVKVTAKRSEIKAARNLGVVVVMFLICLSPYYCVTVTGQDNMFDTEFASFAICLFYFNSCLNPLIYAILYPWFRKSIMLIVTLKILMPNSSLANMR